MKQTHTILILFLAVSSLNGQILTPASWEHSVSKNNASIGEEVELLFTATLDDTWFIYSSENELETGPVPAEFIFEPGDSYELIGDIVPVDFKEKYDEVFKGKVNYKDKEATFKQKVRILKDNPVISVEYYYQVCTTVDGMCVLGDGQFEFKINTN